MITRRRFLQLGGLLAAPLVAGAAAWHESLGAVLVRAGRRLDGYVRSPEARLIAAFEYLTLDPAGVKQFFADYERYRPNFRRRSPLPPDVYTRYLMSTDFFQGGADESRRLQYVLFYDPDVTFCYNPLATFDDVPS